MNRKLLSIALSILAPLAVCAQDIEPTEAERRQQEEQELVQRKQNKISMYGVEQGSIGGGIFTNSTQQGIDKGLGTMIEFRAFHDRDGQRALLFVNANALYNVGGKSAYGRTSVGLGANGDLFMGSRLKSDYRNAHKNVATLYYGVGVNYNVHGQTNAPMGVMSAYDIGPETGLFVMRNEHVFTLSPTVTFGGASTNWFNADGSRVAHSQFLNEEGRLVPINTVGSNGTLGGGLRARYVYADKVFAKFDFIDHSGNPRSAEDVKASPFEYQGNVYRRIYTDGRVKISKKLSLGGQYKYIVFESVNGGPVKIHQLNTTATFIFGSNRD